MPFPCSLVHLCPTAPVEMSTLGCRVVSDPQLHWVGEGRMKKQGTEGKLKGYEDHRSEHQAGTHVDFPSAYGTEQHLSGVLGLLFCTP